MASSITSAALTHTPQELYAWTFHKDAVAPCFVRDVFAMRESGIKDADFFWLGYTPCRSVHIAGMVVGVQVYEKRTLYTIDDGTAVIDCALRHPVMKPPPPSKSRLPVSNSSHVNDAPSPTKRRRTDTNVNSGPPEPPKLAADVGALVEVVGRVAARYETRELVVETIKHCESANAEIMHWARVVDLHRAKYSKAVPFVIPTHPPVSRDSDSSPVRSAVAGPSNASGPPMLLETPRKPRNAAIHLPPSVNGRNKRAVSPASSVFDGSEASSAPSSPTKSSSPTRPQIIKLRHPSRLHSRDLTSNTFRIYLKHHMDNVPVLAAAATSMNGMEPNEGDYGDEAGGVHDSLTTPTKKRSRPSADLIKTPRPSRLHYNGEADATPVPSQKRKGKQKENASDGVSVGEEDDAATPFGFTLSNLRRVPELALLAGRVVRAETRRRAREAREKEKASAHSHFSQQASNPYMLSMSSAATSGSASSSSAPKSRSVKADKEKGDQKKKEDPTRVKKRRLFVWALVRLYEEGAIVLWDADAPRRAPPAPWSFSAIKASPASALSDDNGGENGAGDTSALWKSISGNSSMFSSVSGSTASASASASRLHEGEDDDGALSDPRADEEIYVVLTPALLAREISAVLSARRARGRGRGSEKPSAEEIRKILARDARWARVGVWAVEEAMALL